MSKNSTAIGIDLGTTYSCVGVWKNQKVAIIENEQGNRTTPSYVSFSHEERVIGESAKTRMAHNPMNTIFEAKRMMGKTYTEIKQFTAQWPFKIYTVRYKDERKNRPVVLVDFLGERKYFTAEEISAMILLQMKKTAEKYIKNVKDVVITVPACFNDAQKRATKDAGAIAGLNVLQLLTEPTAAALAYGLDFDKDDSKTILVVDLGGGTYDVSLMKIENKDFKVLAVSGDTHLGGEDFSNVLVDHFAAKFKQL